MLSYYSANIILCWIALGILCILVYENDRLRKERKRVFYLTYGLTALSAFAEWMGVQLDGNASLPKWPLLIAKCADYLLTPVSCGMIVNQLEVRNVWHKLMFGLLAANAVFQIVSLFFGWMLEIDASNHYSHGRFHWVYMSVYLAVVALIVIEFMEYGRSFRRQNQVSLYAILTLALSGGVIQEVFGNDCRTVYLSLTLGMALMFIHTMEFSQLKADEHILAQQIQITTDALTGARNRYAYSVALRDMDAAGKLPENLAAFSIDINGLKAINDTMGHEAGDELICGAAACIQRAMGPWGECYRTGGDEFVVLARMKRGEAQEALRRLKQEADAWKGEKVKRLRLAAGFALALEYPDVSSQKLVSAADMAMYDAKAAYYKASGMDRRRSR